MSSTITSSYLVYSNLQDKLGDSIPIPYFQYILPALSMAATVAQRYLPAFELAQAVSSPTAAFTQIAHGYIANAFITPTVFTMFTSSSFFASFKPAPAAVLTPASTCTSHPSPTKTSLFVESASPFYGMAAWGFCVLGVVSIWLALLVHSWRSEQRIIQGEQPQHKSTGCSSPRGPSPPSSSLSCSDVHGPHSPITDGMGEGNSGTEDPHTGSSSEGRSGDHPDTPPFNGGDAGDGNDSRNAGAPGGDHDGDDGGDGDPHPFGGDDDPENTEDQQHIDARDNPPTELDGSKEEVDAMLPPPGDPPPPPPPPPPSGNVPDVPPARPSPPLDLLLIAVFWVLAIWLCLNGSFEDIAPWLERLANKSTDLGAKPVFRGVQFRVLGRLRARYETMVSGAGRTSRKSVILQPTKTRRPQISVVPTMTRLPPTSLVVDLPAAAVLEGRTMLPGRSAPTTTERLVSGTGCFVVVALVLGLRHCCRVRNAGGRRRRGERMQNEGVQRRVGGGKVRRGTGSSTATVAGGVRNTEKAFADVVIEQRQARAVIGKADAVSVETPAIPIAITDHLTIADPLSPDALPSKEERGGFKAAVAVMREPTKTKTRKMTGATKTVEVSPVEAPVTGPTSSTNLDVIGTLHASASKGQDEASLSPKRKKKKKKKDRDRETREVVEEADLVKPGIPVAHAGVLEEREKEEKFNIACAGAGGTVEDSSVETPITASPTLSTSPEILGTLQASKGQDEGSLSPKRKKKKKKMDRGTRGVVEEVDLVKPVIAVAHASVREEEEEDEKFDIACASAGGTVEGSVVKTPAPIAAIVISNAPATFPGNEGISHVVEVPHSSPRSGCKDQDRKRSGGVTWRRMVD